MSILAGIPLVGKVIETVFGSKLERDRFDADARAGASAQFAAEFGHTKNWFDSLIDGLNRLPRPVITFGIIGLFVMCWFYPERFIIGATNLELIPREMWWILGTVVTFFFGGRMTKDFGRYKIRKEVLEKYQKPPRSFKRTETSFTDPQEGIEWEDRVEKRYKRTDWDNLN